MYVLKTKGHFRANLSSSNQKRCLTVNINIYLFKRKKKRYRAFILSKNLEKMRTTKANKYLKMKPETKKKVQIPKGIQLFQLPYQWHYKGA